MHPVTLTLGPEFGGVSFGPFGVGYLVLGTDPQRCAIALRPAPELRPVHAWLTVQADGSAVVQPAEVGADVFAFEAGRAMATLVTTPRALAPGDAFALGSATGPRFILGRVGQPLPAPAGPPPVTPPVARGPEPAPRRGGRRGLPTAADMQAEANRRLNAELMSKGPVARASHLFHRLQTGALLQPRYIFAALIALAGGAFTLCAGALSLLSSRLP